MMMFQRDDGRREILIITESIIKFSDDFIIFKFRILIKFISVNILFFDDFIILSKHFDWFTIHDDIAECTLLYRGSGHNAK